MWKYTPPYDDVIGGPGNRVLLKGNMQAGFFGEVPASEFITGDELSKMVGMTAGIGQYSDEPWLKFAYMGKVELAAKKPFRYGISYDQINAVGCVDGSKVIKYNGKKYKVRLFKGKTEGKQDDRSAYQGVINHSSEWNMLMLPIHENAPSNWVHKNNVNYPTEDWGVNYTDDDLVTHHNNGKGSHCWCQEYGNSTAVRLLRGYFGVSCASYYWPNDINPSYGWRPVLELIG